VADDLDRSLEVLALGLRLGLEHHRGPTLQIEPQVWRRAGGDRCAQSTDGYGDGHDQRDDERPAHQVDPADVAGGSPSGCSWCSGDIDSSETLCSGSSCASASCASAACSWVIRRPMAARAMRMTTPGLISTRIKSP